MDEKLIKSSGINVIVKPLAMLISFMYTPVLLNFLGDEQYGVWVTILSIINWIYSFDIGIGNGLRNILVRDIVKQDKKSINQDMSTAYISLFLLTAIIFIVSVVVGYFIDWNKVLNTSIFVDSTLLISFLFICINFVLSLYKNAYFALQESEKVAISGVEIQIINFILVYGISKVSNNSQIIIMSYVFGISSLLVNIWYSVKLWYKNPHMRPQIKGYKKTKLNEICTIGIQFFVIQIAGIILFTTDNLLISHIYTPTSVTSYSTVNKVFSAIFSVFMAALAPMWSRFTLEKENNNYSWMKNTIGKLLLLWLIFSIGTLIIVPMYPWLSNLWLRKELQYDAGIVIVMAIYFIVYMYSGIFSTVINGLGDIKIQLFMSIASAVVNIPLSLFFAINCDMKTTGIALGTLVSLLIGNIVFTIQVFNIIIKNTKRESGL